MPPCWRGACFFCYRNYNLWMTPDSLLFEFGTNGNTLEEAKYTARLVAPILGEFTATDLAGNEVTQSVFEGHPVTMVNVWATFCGPCLREMPDLGALHQEFSEQGFQILGIVTDVQAPDGSISQEQVDLAAQIAEETGASYLHLLPSEDLIACLLWQVSSVPTTIFVDETGALIGKGYLGSRDAAAWRSIIEEKLEAVSAGEDAK